MSTLFDKILTKFEVDKLLLDLRKIIEDKSFNAKESLLVIQKKKNKEFMLENNFRLEDVNEYDVAFPYN